MANNPEVERLMELVEDYARHLVKVDFWSGKVKNSCYLTPAYDAKAKLEKALASTITY